MNGLNLFANIYEIIDSFYETSKKLPCISLALIYFSGATFEKVVLGCVCDSLPLGSFLRHMSSLFHQKDQVG